MIAFSTAATKTPETKSTPPAPSAPKSAPPASKPSTPAPVKASKPASSSFTPASTSSFTPASSKSTSSSSSSKSMASMFAKASAFVSASLHKDSFEAVGFHSGNASMKLGGAPVVEQTGGTGGTAPTIDDVVVALQAGSTDEATRTMIAEYFTPLNMAESTAAMQRIRDEGLLGAFIDATARDNAGNPVTPEVKAGLERIMETGRLDVYAETLATVPITVGTYKDAAGNGLLQFNPNPPAGIELDGDAFTALSADDGRNVLAHEMFHAFSNAHGGDGYSALDEGFGIAVRGYAFTDTSYNVAEMVYGTMNYYRDIVGDASYTLGDFSGADPKLMELMGAVASRDSSQLAWTDPTQLQSDYDTFFAPINRNQDFGLWTAAANQATADMLAARPATPTPSPVTATPVATVNPTVTPVVAPEAPTLAPSGTPEPSTIR